MPVVSAGGVRIVSTRRVLSIVAAGRTAPVAEPAPAKTAAVETVSTSTERAAITPSTETARMHYGCVGEADRADHQECLRYPAYRTASVNGPIIHGFASSAFMNAICLASLGSWGWKRLDAMSLGYFQPDKIAMYSGE